MSTLPFIRASEVEHLLSWKVICDAIIAGHRLERADIDDILFRNGENTMLNRAAWVKGLGIGIKTATIFPGNAKRTPALPSVHTVFTLFDDQTGAPVALIDGNMVTKWKTAADSVLGARLLARPESKTLLIIGAGTVANSLVEAYSEVFPGLEQVLIWNRTAGRARELASRTDSDRPRVKNVKDLASSVALADMISSATMSIEPVLKGEWVSPGTHVDLIGAYRPDMREADDALIQKAELFVDSRATAIHDIGELAIPIQQGTINELDIRADLYDLCNGVPGRPSAQAITVYKNGGGAHLDLMTAKFIFTTFSHISEA
jgi:ornithine cyclodeaminase/alanine dehydrogenase-like protein (mu-crystallin family)